MDVDRGIVVALRNKYHVRSFFLSVQDNCKGQSLLWSLGPTECLGADLIDREHGV